MDPALRGRVLLRHVGLDTPRSGVEKIMWSPPARDGQEARWTPLCGVLRHVGLDTPRSGVEKRMWSPRPQWAGGAVDPARRGLGACWVRHPTEWGGEENVVPPARNGQEARWTLHGRVLRHVGLDTPRSGVEKECGPPRPRWAGGAVDPALRGRVLLREACWVRHPTEWGGEVN